MAGDGQVTLGDHIQKQGAVKVHALNGGRVLAGIAGGAADALALLDRFESKLDSAGGQLRRAAVELAKDWRTDRALRRLEAVMLLADHEQLLLVSGSGDVIAPDGNCLATGSGGALALAAARSLLEHTELPADAVCRAALEVAAEIDLYTNSQIALLEVATGDAS